MKMINILVGLILMTIPDMYCQTISIFEPLDTLLTEVPFDTLAQVTFDDTIASEMASPITPAYSADRNYIQTRTYRNESGTAYLNVIQYYDGLSRPLQTVQKSIIPTVSIIQSDNNEAFSCMLPHVGRGRLR